MATTETINSFLFTLFGFQKTRSRTHLLLIIAIHLSAWCLFFLLPLIFYPIRVSNRRFLYGELIGKLLPIGLFYLNYYCLLPYLFEKRRFISYFSVVLAIVLLIAGQEVLIRKNFAGWGVRFFGTPMEAPFNGPERPAAGVFVIKIDQPDSMRGPVPVAGFREDLVVGIPKRILLMSINRSISLSLVLLLISGFLRLGYSFLKNQNEKRALENAHLNAEVNFLKSQINPHFLFNTLNGIYAQAHSRSEHTENSILKLSDLLRYVLYDTSENKVDLRKDIQYLTNYIDLQKIRLSKKVTIRYEVSGDLDGKKIAPLLLITFVENAFKHGISYTRPSVIIITIGIFEKTLTLVVSNPVVETNSFAHGGLGLKNVTRRLDLLYPGNYLMDIVHNAHLHVVNLKINLDSD
jgi:two-component system, LytTR family, sensor kinase